jgi:hypothetical protein
VNGDARRVRLLTLAGVTDSLGLATGWTVFNLIAVYRHGLAVTGLLNAAMLCGVAASAPAASWLTQRLNGRRTLELTAAFECVLRAATLAALYWNAPVPILAAMVFVMNVVAWVGYAAMRSEVAAASGSEWSMTKYVAAIISIEAVGATLAAVLPITSSGGIAAHWVAAVMVVYGISLLPTAMVARQSPVPVLTPRGRGQGARAVERRLLLIGAAVMAVCSGPTLLYVALAAKLHGRTSVAGAAMAFAVGSLLAPAATRAVQRHGVAASTMWTVWGAGMIAGWALATWSLVGLCVAQLLSGVALTGFEGAMDNALASTASSGSATTALARGSASRALGGAVAVRMVPMFAASAALARFSAGAMAACLLAAVGAHAWSRGWKSLSTRTQPSG